jgi:hypothetical protein
MASENHPIKTLESLHSHLYAGMQLEHATIPPYLTALYSIHHGANPDAVHVLRVVAVEEMLHLTLVANVLNAVGGTPDLTRPDFVPTYPTALPDGEDDFEVGLLPFSMDALDGFLSIERPGEAIDVEGKLVKRTKPQGEVLGDAGHPEERYYSIGEFYEAITAGLNRLHKEMGDALFSGDPAKQCGPEYYYSGGGQLVRVTDIASARAALRLIGEQGEGLHGGIYDAERELSHYYRFEQLKLGRYYNPGDDATKPTGPPLDVDFDAVYNLKANARMTDYEEGSELHAAALDFNRRYADFLGLLTRAYNGSPELLLDAVPEMFRIRDAMLRLIRNPIPGLDGVYAAPTFEVAEVAGRAAV